MSTDFVQFERLHRALQLIGFESPFDKRIFHNCPDREFYVDISKREIKEFMTRQELRRFKGIFKYVNSEFRKMGLKSINVRNRISTTVNRKRRKYKTWSLHQGSPCATSFETMSFFLCRQRAYLEEKPYLKSNIDFNKLEKATIGVKRKR